MPEPLQIIATGDADTDFFVLKEENLNSIISQIPADAKVSIVSVVGAFRTGKSFLLNFFLRYLRFPAEFDDLTDAWMSAEGEFLSEGNMNECTKHDSPSTAASSSSDGWNLVDGTEDGSSPEGVGAAVEPKKKGSFQWRGGKERQTTGIWMWSEPFIRSDPKNKKQKVAVLLMDTQGMFDNETSMTLTAQIFGLSTLVSSFQVYNVDKRIQEDNLQHLALFSEYGRMALLPQQDKKTVVKKAADMLKAKNEALLKTAAKTVEDAASAAAGEEKPTTSGATEEKSSGDSDEKKEKEENDEEKSAPVMIKPFQHLQFLVRDWQNFDTDWIEPRAKPLKKASPAVPVAAAVVSTSEEEEGAEKQKKAASDETEKTEKVDEKKEEDDLSVSAAASASATVEDALPSTANMAPEIDKYIESEEEVAMHAAFKREMNTYLQEVLSARGLSDLQSTRDQILRCFDTIDCYLLPHPGGAVTRKTYDGSIDSIDPFFRCLLNKYVRSVFDYKEMQPKVIAGRTLNGTDLKTYFEVYVKMFQAGQKSFPKAMTLLDATAEANNRTAYDGALSLYRRNMDDLVGPDTNAYVKTVELEERHVEFYEEAINYFTEGATMGAEVVIARLLETLKATIEEEKTRYFATNALRNPFRDVEMYVIPVGVMIVSWFLAIFVDKTCSSDFCESTESTFRNIYLFIFFALVVIMWKQIQGAIHYVREFVLPALAGNVSSSSSTSGGGGGGGGVARKETKKNK